MKLNIAGEGWTAECLFTDNAGPDKFIHVEGRVDGKSKESALSGARTIIELFGHDRLVMVRAEPEADSFKEFDTQKTLHRGYVRFSYFAGGLDKRWQRSPHAISIPSFGEQVP